MPESFDKPIIIRLLSELRQKDRQRLLFGSKMHDYRLNPPIELSTIEQFESRHGITLPGDYRRFITEIGNGGAGPYDGFFPFGEVEEGRSWEEGNLVGDVSQPFPHVEPWNLPATFWEQFPVISPDTPPEEEEKLLAAWDKLLLEHYFNPAIMNGAIPICPDGGYGQLQWLVVNWEQKGFIWDDFRGEDGGIRPLRDESGRQMTFSAWYMAWLSDSLTQPIPKRRRELTPLELIAGGVLLGLAMMGWALLPILPRMLVAVGLLLGLVIALWKRPRVLRTLLGLIVAAAGLVVAMALLGNTLSLALLWAVVLFGVVKAWLHR